VYSVDKYSCWSCIRVRYGVARHGRSPGRMARRLGANWRCAYNYKTKQILNFVHKRSCAIVDQWTVNYIAMISGVGKRAKMCFLLSQGTSNLHCASAVFTRKGLFIATQLNSTRLNLTDPVEQRIQPSQSCFCLWRHNLQTELTVVHAVELSSVELSWVVSL